MLLKEKEVEMEREKGRQTKAWRAEKGGRMGRYNEIGTGRKTEQKRVKAILQKKKGRRKKWRKRERDQDRLTERQKDRMKEREKEIKRERKKERNKERKK